MNNLTSAGLTCACVVGIAGAIFFSQHRSLRTLRTDRADQVARSGAAPEDVQPPQPGQPPPPAPTPPIAPGSQPPSVVADGSHLVDRIIGALEQKRATLEEAGDTAAAAVWAERLDILLDLSPEQSESARTFFHRLTVQARQLSVRPDLDDPARREAFAALEQRLADYLSAQLGEEKALRFRTAERARQEATIEHQAGEALQALAQVVDLPPAQKDALYTAFAEKARDRTSTFHPGELKPQFTYAFQEGPRLDDPLALARNVLTPDQIALYEKNRASESREQQRGMQTALLVMREVFQQALGQAPAAESGAK